MKLFRRKAIDWRGLQARIIGETGDYLTECFRNPDMAVRIPTVRADRANWTREFAEEFWNDVL